MGSLATALAKAKGIGRWIVLVPAAALASFVTPAVVKYISRFAPYPDPDSMLGHVIVEAWSGLAMGAVFVYVGTWIAPGRRRAVALTLAVIGAALMAVATLGNVIGAHYWKVWQGICAALGAYAVASAERRGEIELGTPSNVERETQSGSLENRRRGQLRTALQIFAGALIVGTTTLGLSYCAEFPKYQFERRIPGIVAGWPGARLISSIKSVDLASPVSWFWPPTTIWTYVAPVPEEGGFLFLPIVYGEETTSFLVDVDCQTGLATWYDLDEPKTALPAIDIFGREVKARDGRTFRMFKYEQKDTLNETQMHALCHTDWKKERAAVFAARRH